MPSARRWFKIHLSTAVVLMLVFGALLGLNLRHRSIGEGINWYDVNMTYAQGWPFDARVVTPAEADFGRELLRSQYSTPITPTSDKEYSFVVLYSSGVPLPSKPTIWSRLTEAFRDGWHRTLPFRGIFWDMGIAAGILTSVAVLCEWRIRPTR
jgi:hypothetical protein